MRITHLLSNGRLRAASLICLALFWTSPAWAKIYLDINAPTIRRLPLAIQVFKNLRPERGGAEIGRELHETVSSDLDFSGLFQLLDPVSFIEDPLLSQTDPSRILFQDWRVIGADALIKGAWSMNGDQLQAEFYLYDVYQQKQILGKRYYGGLGDVRKMAHKFANEVIKEITGEAGVFDTRIVYLSITPTARQIHIMDYDGHNDRVIYEEEGIVMSPRWAPDGEQIVFTSYRDNNPDLFQIALRTGSVLKVSGESGINTGGAYSPGGGQLAYVMSKDGNPEIYILDKYAKKPRRVTNNWSTDVSPAWSPDGEKIAFMSDRAGSPHIYIMERDGDGPYRLTFQGSYNATPAWSPRGDRIALATMNNGHFQIATIKPDKSEFMIITANAGDNETPAWSPDGRFLCFSSTMDGKADIYVMNANGSNLRRITSSAARNLAPHWSPRLVFD